MLKWFVIILIFGFLKSGRTEVIVTELSGTNNAEYGTSHSLQCSFNFENETGVEIKWFYNGDDQIFVWIPNRSKPNAIDSWKDVLDTNATTPDHDVKHSVLHFKELNFNLTGYYTCKVTGDEHEDAKTEKMIVYRPASFIDFEVVSEQNNTVTLSCSVFETFPKPEINVTGSYLPEKNGTVLVYLRNETSEGDQDTFFNITKVFTLNTDELISPTIELTCMVTIGETSYSLTKAIQYTKSGDETTTTENTEYYLNYTTISTEIENSTKINTAHSTTKQGGAGTRIHSVYSWQVLLLLAVVGKWML